jgi:FG-GAP repeat/IPT/TIG domain
MTERLALATHARVGWRALALAALLSVLFGALVSQLSQAGHGSSSAVATGSAGVGRAGLLSLSAPARSSISAALGAEAPAYRVIGEGGGSHAVNPAQHLRIGFGRSRVVVASESLKVGLGMRAIGYGDSLQAVGAVSPRVNANRVTYSHAGFSEWYENGPLGLEQGFTLTRAPASAAALGLTLAIAVSGGARVSAVSGGDGVTLGSANEGALRYGGLNASDAGGRALRTWMTLDGNELLLHVDTRGARFPLTVDPVIEEEPERKFTAGAEEANEGGRFGVSAALSEDGNTALIGAPGDDGGIGAAWVFTRSGTTWVKQGTKLTVPKAAVQAGDCDAEAEEPGEEPGEESGEEPQQCHFGQSVALSDDASTAVIGSPRETGNVGKAWIFTREGSTWTQSQELTSPEESAKTRFGGSVAVSGDGDTVLVGAPRLRGHVWTFTRSGSSWSQTGAALTGAGEQGEGFFGHSIALSADGETAVVGAPLDANNSGGVWIFKRSPTGWVQQGPKLTGAGQTAGARFGYSVALSGDASTVLVGARANEGGDGAAWVFADSGAGYGEQGPALVGGESKEEFGYSVALSFDGSTALIGADGAGEGRGQAWLFERSGTSWGAAQAELGAGKGQGAKARFGSSVSMSADAETRLAGGRLDAKAGSAWVFGLGPSVTAVAPAHGPPAGATTVTVSGEHLTGATAVRFGANPAASFTVESDKSIVAVSPPGVGVIDIVVETSHGTSATNPADQFTYERQMGKEGGEEEGEGGKKGGKGKGGGTQGNSGLGITGAGTVVQSGVLALGPTSSVACGVSLHSKKIPVQPSKRALLTLVGTGTGKCAGKLRLRVKIKHAHKRSTLKTIGTAVFSISAHRTLLVRVKLNPAGRALLKAGHGHLNASLLLVKSLPVPVKARTASVKLTQQKPRKPTTTQPIAKK